MYSGSSAIAEGCVEGNCNNGKGTYIYADGEKYVGEFKDNNRNGQGTYTYPDGEKYVGEWKDGIENGQGTYKWPDGRKYSGEHKDGKANGQGTYIFPDGAKYVGEWKDDKQHGQGTQTYANGDYCTGKFNNGKCLGKTVKLDRAKRNKIAEAKLVCEDLGFTPGTEEFAECALKLSTEGSDKQNTKSNQSGFFKNILGGILKK